MSHPFLVSKTPIFSYPHTNFLPVTAQPLSVGITLHELMIIISAVCTILSWAIMIPLAWLHLRNWTNPSEQRHIVRVSFTIPIMATFNLFMCWFYNASWYIEPLPQIVEAFGVVSLFYLFVTYVTPNETLREQFYDNIERQSRNGKPKQGREGQGSLRWFHTIWILVFQLIVGRIGTTIASELLTATECPMSNKLEHHRTIVVVIENIETVVALLAILRYYGRLRPHLKPRGAMRQLLIFKGIVFLTLFPNTIIQALVSFKVVKPTNHISFEDWQLGLPALIACVLMFLFSPLFLWAFSAQQYREAARHGAQRQPIWKALIEIINLWDVIRGVGLTYWIFVPGNYGKRYVMHEKKLELSPASSNQPMHPDNVASSQQQPGGSYEVSTPHPVQNGQQFHQSYP